MSIRFMHALWPFQRPLGNGFRVVGVTTDRRTKAQRESHRSIAQDMADTALEKRWRDKVRKNEIRRMEKRLLERVEAEMMEQPRFRRMQAI